MKTLPLLLCLLFAFENESSVPDESTDTPVLLVLGKSDASLSFVHADTGVILTSLKTGVGPHEIAVSPNGRIGVVANYGQREPGRSLGVYDLFERKLIREIDLGEHRRPHGLQFRGDETLFVTSETSKAILRLNVNNGKIEAVLKTDQQASHMLVLSPTAPRAFVSNIGSGSVTVFDTESGERLAQIPTGAGAEGIDITPDGSEVWVGNRSADTLTVIDANSLKVIDQLPCGTFPIRIKFTPKGTHALVSNANSGELAVFDVLSRKEIHRFSMEVEASEDKAGRLFGGSFEGSPVPVGILVRPNGEYAYIANTNADVISIVSLSEWKVIGRLTAGKEPDGLGWTRIPSASGEATD